MKNKKVIILLVVIMLALIVIGFCYFYNKSFKEDISFIEYSFGGGYGTKADTETIFIKFKDDNQVEISAIEGKINKVISINEDDVNELKNIIKENVPKLKEDLSNHNVMDGSYSHIKINGTHNFGGYAVNDENYCKITSKIYEIVGQEEIGNIREKIKEYYDED